MEPSGLSRSSSTSLFGFNSLSQEDDLSSHEGGKRRTNLETLSKSLSDKIDTLQVSLDSTWASFATTISRLQGSLDTVMSVVAEKLSPIDVKVKEFFRKSHRVENRLGRFVIRAFKSPFEGAYNVVKVVLCIFRLIANVLIHPINTILNVGKALASFINPKKLTLLGAAIIGSATAVAAIFGFAPVALLIAGAALIVLGLTLGGIDAVLSRPEDESIREALKKMLFKHFKKLPAKFVTGFIFGAIVSGITIAAGGQIDPTAKLRELQTKFVANHHQYYIWVNQYQQWVPWTYPGPDGFPLDQVFHINPLSWSNAPAGVVTNALGNTFTVTTNAGGAALTGCIVNPVALTTAVPVIPFVGSSR